MSNSEKHVNGGYRPSYTLSSASAALISLMMVGRLKSAKPGALPKDE